MATSSRPHGMDPTAQLSVTKPTVKSRTSNYFHISKHKTRNNNEQQQKLSRFPPGLRRRQCLIGPQRHNLVRLLHHRHHVSLPNSPSRRHHLPGSGLLPQRHGSFATVGVRRCAARVSQRWEAAVLGDLPGHANAL